MSIKIPFCTYRQVIKQVKVPFSIKELQECLSAIEPSEIFHDEWSSDKPFILITQYLADGYFMCFCNAWADKTPQKHNAESLYEWLKFQGFDSCFIKTETQ